LLAWLRMAKKSASENKLQKKKQRSENSQKEIAHNPFEQRTAKQRFKILGRKIKNAQQNTGELRSKSIEQRKKTLLLAFQQKGKANKFYDGRWEEQNENISAEEKALIRFQKEAAKRYAKKKHFQSRRR